MQILNSDFQVTDVAGSQLRSASGAVDRVDAKREQASAQMALPDAARKNSAAKDGKTSFEDVFVRENPTSENPSKTGPVVLSSSDVKTATAIPLTPVPQTRILFDQQGQSTLQNVFGVQNLTEQEAVIAPILGVAVVSDTDANAPDDVDSDVKQEGEALDLEDHLSDMALTVADLNVASAAPKHLGDSHEDVTPGIPSIQMSSAAPAMTNTEKTVPEGASVAMISAENKPFFKRQDSMAVDLTSGSGRMPVDARAETDALSAATGKEGTLVGKAERETNTITPDSAPASALREGEHETNFNQPSATERKENTERVAYASAVFVKDSSPSAASQASDMPVDRIETRIQTAAVETVETGPVHEQMGKQPDNLIATPEQEHNTNASGASQTPSKETVNAVVSQAALNAFPESAMSNEMTDDLNIQGMKEGATQPDSEPRETKQERREQRLETAAKPLDAKAETKTDSSIDQPVEFSEAQPNAAEETTTGEDADAMAVRDTRAQAVMPTPEASATTTAVAVAANESLSVSDEKPEISEGLDELTSLSGTSRDHQIARDLASPTSAANRIELPNRVAMQLADAARQLPDKPVEITLTPEELGKVRLSFHVSENGAMQVVIATERPETLDLLRRNIDSLAAEFKDLGYANSGFSFESFDQGSQQGDSSRFTGFGDLGATESSGGDIDTRPDPVRLTLGGTSGMDLRL